MQSRKRKSNDLEIEADNDCCHEADYNTEVINTGGEKNTTVITQHYNV